MHVRMQGLVNLLADGVHRRSDVRAVGVLIHLLHGDLGDLPHILVLDEVHLAVGFVPEGVLQRGSHVLQPGALLAAHQGYVPVVIQIGTGRRHLGEIVGEGHLAVVTGHLFPGAGLLEGFAPFDGHLAAVSQGEGLAVVGGILFLGHQADGAEGEACNQCQLFHILFFVILSYLPFWKGAVCGCKITANSA